MKLLAGKISGKKKYILIILGALLIAAALTITYIMGGFRLITGDSEIQQAQNTSQNKYLSEEFSSKFRTMKLPFSIELSNVKLDTAGIAQLEVSESKVYLNEYDRKYNYFACCRIGLPNQNNAYIILKTPKNGTFEQRYFIRIFNKNYELRGQMKLADFSSKGDSFFANEAIIKEDYSIITTKKATTIDRAGSNLKPIHTLQSTSYKIKSDGGIEKQNN